MFTGRTDSHSSIVGDNETRSLSASAPDIVGKTTRCTEVCISDTTRLQPDTWPQDKSVKDLTKTQEKRAPSDSENVKWGQAKSKSIEICGQELTCYWPEKAFAGVKNKLFILMASEWCEEMLAALNQQQVPTINTEKLYLSWREQKIETFKDSNVRMGLSDDELIKALEQTYNRLNECVLQIQRREDLTSPLGFMEGFDRGVELSKAANAIYHGCELESLGQATYLNDIETDMEELPPPQNLTCAHYAMMMTEKKMTTKVVIELSDLPSSKNLLWWIEKGYRPVKEPKEGDLVVYFSDNQTELAHMKMDSLYQAKDIIHYAIYKGDHQAVSKPGASSDYVYRHDVFSLLGLYGNRIAFIRKLSAST